MQNLLYEYFIQNPSKKEINKYKHYFQIYEKHFQKFVGKKTLIFEIGVGCGGSIQMWKNYFGNNSVIVGIDIDESKKQHEILHENIFVEIGNQNDTIFLKNLIEKYGIPDVVIDDGSHIFSDQISSFKFLYEKMNSDSIYLVEDTHTSYWITFDGGLNKPGTFIEFVKSKFDELNGRQISQKMITDFTTKTICITLYDSVVVFEKGEFEIINCVSPEK